jgi:hypothetical protein
MQIAFEMSEGGQRDMEDLRAYLAEERGAGVFVRYDKCSEKVSTCGPEVRASTCETLRSRFVDAD